jgi:hypothetical protein
VERAVPQARARVGLPDAQSIIAESELSSTVATGTRALRAVAGTTAATQPAVRGRYRILTTAEVDAYETPLRAGEVEMFGLNRVRVAGDRFQGTAREAAKLTIPDADVETFDNVAAFLKSLPKKDPQVSDDQDSGRIDTEERVVRLRALLYAASREADNDFHLIVGDKGSSPKMMTMEVSGLPSRNAPSFARLKSARDAYKDFFGGQLPGLGYDHYDPPIPVEVEGAPFYDASHSHGQPPGPQKLRPFMPRIWELHPITEIVFEPDGAG